jgi:hypothetical protein
MISSSLRLRLIAQLFALSRGVLDGPLMAAGLLCDTTHHPVALFDQPDFREMAQAEKA